MFLVLSAVVLGSLISASVVSVPLFLVGLGGWIAIARLLLPFKQAIPGRRKGTNPVFGWGTFAAIALTIWFLSQVSETLVPLAYGFVGFPVGLAISLTLELTWHSKLLYCEKCRTYKYFLRDGGMWFCSVCGGKSVERSRLVGKRENGGRNPW